MGQHIRSKWWLIGAFWILQGAAVYLLTPIMIVSAGKVDPDKGDMGSVVWGDYVGVLQSLEWFSWAVWVIPAITLAQLIFVWPVHKPAPKRERGWPIWRSLAVTGLAVAALSTALLLGVSQVINTYTKFDIFDATGIHIHPSYVVVAWCLMSWALATPLLIRFCRRGSREGVLARVSAYLFTGTIVETAAIIPLDVLVRKRENCYCHSGTYFALLISGGVGVLVLGPAVLFLLLVKRRKRWYDGKCEWCGYDMSATLKAEKCPECGMGWRMEGQRGKGA